MTAQCSTVKKLPRAWWGLFVTFQNETKPHVAAEFWWRNSSMSKYAETPEWEVLLKSLLSLEPQLIDGNLILYDIHLTFLLSPIFFFALSYCCVLQFIPDFYIFNSQKKTLSKTPKSNCGDVTYITND